MKRKETPPTAKTTEQLLVKAKEDYAIIPPPTRFFKAGDLVCLGSLGNAVVQQDLGDGFYLVEYDSTERGQPTGKRETRIWAWMSILPRACSEIAESLYIQPEFRLNYSQCGLDSLLHLVYHSGLDINPAYQRKFVWDETDQQMLLDSIFHGRSIGSFVFRELPYEEGKRNGYEIVDGKQRLTTICAFYEGRIPYHGKFYHELSIKDHRRFREHPTSKATIRDITDTQVMELFLFLNKTGRAQTAAHLEHVEGLIKAHR